MEVRTKTWVSSAYKLKHGLSFYQVTYGKFRALLMLMAMLIPAKLSKQESVQFGRE